MKKQLLFAFSLVLAVLLSSCKDMGALDSSMFTCTPNPLEVKAGKVDATITGKFPVKYFNKRAVVTVTPVLKFDGKEVKGTPVKFQGEKVKGNDKTIAFKAGGTYTMKASFDYVPEMAVSELYLEFSVETKKKTYAIPAVKVADGVIATATLATTNFGTDAANGPVIIADRFQRVIQEKEEASIKFLIQQSNLRPSETRSAEIVGLTKKIKEVQDAQNKAVAGFEVSGYASPDGAIELNTNLAERRQKVTVDFVNSEMKKLKTSVTIDSKFTAEDWAGFQKLMESSNIQDKELILRVLSMYPDPEQREREIKNLSVAFKAIADEILPQLRRSRLTLTVDVTGKSDEEILGLAKSNPSGLSLEELLYAATLTQDLATKADFYTKATQLHSSCVRAFNNLAVVNYQQGNIDAASKNIAKALELNAGNADVNFNAGMLALAKKDIAGAEVYFGKAGGTNGNLKNALGTVYIAKGEYDKARTSFGDAKTNNAALLQILNKDYSAAKNTLAAVAQPDGLTAYLSAIVAARTNDKDGVYSNLRNAVRANAKCGAKAAKDIEFAKYFADDTFKSIVK